MRKTGAALVFTMVMLLTGAAHATTLVATQGFLVTMGLDSAAIFSGDGFSVFMSHPYGFPNGNFTTTMNVVPLDDQATVQVGGLVCDAITVGSTCGSITVTNAPLTPRPADWPAGVNYSAWTEFSAIGHLNVGEGFDVVGQGLLVGTDCFDFSQPPCVSLSGSPVLLYTFSVAEPPTLLLIVAAFGVLGTLFSARFLRDRRHRSRLLGGTTPMSKIAAAILFTMVTVLTGAAQATTLTITEGTILAFDRDSQGTFSGEGFAGQFSHPEALQSFESNPVGVASFVATLQLEGGLAGVVSVVGDGGCVTQIMPIGTTCGFITFTSPGLTSTDLTMPFTASGHFDLARATMSWGRVS
jgi:hypothetical protein